VPMPVASSGRGRGAGLNGRCGRMVDVLEVLCDDRVGGVLTGLCVSRRNEQQTDDARSKQETVHVGLGCIDQLMVFSRTFRSDRTSKLAEKCGR
jgi:hypothetical protein